MKKLPSTNNEDSHDDLKDFTGFQQPSLLKIQHQGVWDKKKKKQLMKMLSLQNGLAVTSVTRFS